MKDQITAYNEAQRDDIFNLLEPFYKEGYTENITGNVCKGDDIVFVEAIFTSSYWRAKFSHFEIIKGIVKKDSYGEMKQQHTFTITTVSGDIRRKGRNVYKHITLAKPRDMVERKTQLDDKYKRGERARQSRQDRISAPDGYTCSVFGSI